MPVPDDTDEKVNRGTKRALVSEEEPGKKRKKSNTTHTKNPTSASQASGPVPQPIESIPPKGSKSTPSTIPTEISMAAPKHPTKTPTKETTGTEQKPSRATAVDFIDSDNLGDRSSISKPSTSRTPTPKSIKSKLSHGSNVRLSETKTILKSSKKVAEHTTTDMPAKEKHVKFAVKLSDSKKRDRALGATDKRVRSGGGKSASAKDGVLGKKVAAR